MLIQVLNNDTKFESLSWSWRKIVVLGLGKVLVLATKVPCSSFHIHASYSYDDVVFIVGSYIQVEFNCDGILGKLEPV